MAAEEHAKQRTNVCYCGLEPVVYSCKKNGPNFGREFYSCKNRKCRYFQPVDGKPWITEERRPPPPQQQQPPRSLPPKRRREEDVEETPDSSRSQRPLEGFISAAKLLHGERKKNYRTVVEAVKQAQGIASQLVAALEMAATLCPRSCMEDSGDSSPEEDPTTPLKAPVQRHVHTDPCEEEVPEPPKKKERQQEH